jgi:hypothetical protein
VAKVAFEVFGDTVVTLARPGGTDLVLTAGKRHVTDDPAEILDLDANPAVQRVKEKD